jgi:arylsulfatase A-like enzyme
LEHGHSLFSDVLSVPLIVQYPDRPFGRVDLAPASGVDLVPTVLDTLELELPAGLAGRSLRELSEDPRARVAQHDDTAHSVQYDGWKLIVGRVAGADGRPDAIQLYDLHADPGELDDIAEAVPEWVRRLQAMLDESRQTNRPLGPRPVEAVFDPAVLGDLQRLGYLGGR